MFFWELQLRESKRALLNHWAWMKNENLGDCKRRIRNHDINGYNGVQNSELALEATWPNTETRPNPELACCCCFVFCRVLEWKDPFSLPTQKVEKHRLSPTQAIASDTIRILSPGACLLSKSLTVRFWLTKSIIRTKWMKAKEEDF